jgi:RNA polymerase sigma-70 factor (ECF subfamily)
VTLAEVTLAHPAAAAAPAWDFASVVRQHQSMVYSLALHFLRDPSAAEEVTQEVFLRLHRNLHGLKSDAHLVFWLRQVASRHCIDNIRRSKARPEVSLEDAREPSVAAVNGDPLLSDRLRRLVASLPADLRIVVVLRYQEDLEPDEIAEVLDLPLGTVRDHLRKGLDLLRRKAGPYLGEV